jgi:hypothetical protein
LIVVGILPTPLPCFIEDDITGDDYTLVDGVVAVVGLGPNLIPDEDHLVAPVIELLQVRSRDLEVRDAAKLAEVVDGGDLAVPSFIWRIAVESARRGAIEDVDHRRHSLTPKVPGQPFRLEHASRNGDHALVAPLYHPVLLWAIGGSQLALDAVLSAIQLELHGGEFASLIGTEHLQLLPCLHLDNGLEILDL